MKNKVKLLMAILILFAMGTNYVSAQIKIGDNLGNHKAIKDLDMNTNKIVNASGAVIGAATFTNASVALELAGTDKAILINRVATLAAILLPVDGMVVFQNSDSKMYVRQGGAWVTFGTSNNLVTSLTASAVGATPNGDGLTLSSSQGTITINLQPADATRPGVLTAGSQTIGGNKTFTGTTTFQDVVVSAGINAANISPSTNVADVILVQDASGNVKKSALFAGSIMKVNVPIPGGTSALFTSDNMLITVTLTVAGIAQDDGVVVNFSNADQASFVGLTILSSIATAANTVKVYLADVRNPADPSYAAVAIDAKNLTVTYLHK